MVHIGATIRLPYQYLLLNELKGAEPQVTHRDLSLIIYEPNFDNILLYSKGGTSNTSDNVQL